ncbi:transcription initiation factor TFIID subunit 4 isoform X6 [Anthonomus grandis grandis]|uniref:transcription initiation factor TFIID subunit 4 isoform X6 n=1 Tax=Anthonomus grandis grandis TaxID=2921223 RepID=UPI0021665536|nr:transcription initiation factor TFIID subunit 4 isoform X6 [Anthonomus grandis grandis]
MASAKFLEEALNTDVDESAVNALVGSLENQLGTAAVPHTQPQNSILQQNHVNSPISNGGTTVQPQAPQQQQQKHGTMANGDSIITTNNSNSVSSAVDKQMNNAFMNASQPTAITSPYTLQQQQIDQKPPEGVKIVYSQGGQVMGGQQGPAVMQQRPQGQIPNGTIGMSPQTVLGTPNSNISQVPVQKPPTIVLKTNNPGGTPGLVTVPVNAVQQANNQLTLQSFHGLQPGQQGALLLKTENGQYQLLRVGPAPPTASNLATSQPGAQPMTFRMQTVPAQAVSSAATNAVQAGSGTTTVSSTAPIVQTTQPAQRTANDNTKEKCRKFLANLLELSSREPKSVERNVRTLIQELIDNKVEPEDFCDKLERLLNASPQPCLIGFLKKSLPLLRQSLANNELTIDGIRPPPSNIVFSVTGAAPTVQTVRAAVPPTGAGPGVQQVRIVGPGGSTVVRAPAPGAVLQQRLLGPLRTPGVQQQQARMVTTIRQPVQTQAQTAVQQQQLQQQSISSTQPPALHPVYGAGTPQQLQGAPPNAIVGQHQVQQRVAAPPRTVQVRPGGQTRPPPQRVATAAGGKSLSSAAAGKGAIAVANRSLAKEKEKKSFSAAYTGDDDINDVAAMGGVNLAEETQKILGSTEYVGTQIRSCKEEIMCSMGSLQSKIRQVMSKHGLEDPSNDVAACISHAAQERLRDLVEKLAVITEHRLEIVKSDSRYEVTNDVKGQLKFLEDLDKAERKKHEELEREMLLRAAKSRSKTEDPEQAKLKAKAKEMQRVEMEELRQREANATALQAIGPRKKPRLDGETTTNSQAPTSGPNNAVRGQMPLRQRIKKVTMRDLQFLFESEKDLAKSKLLYKAYLK